MNLDTTPETYVLFLDLEEFEDIKNVTLNVIQAEKHPNNPVLPLGDIDEWDSVQARPWEGRLYSFTFQNLVE